MQEKVKVQNNLLRSEDVSTVQDNLISILKQESDSILYLIENFPLAAAKLMEKILSCTGRIVFTGMGKSGIIGKKLAATFSSVGIPSFFLHPSEALHGDLGMVQKNDLVISLSKSGFSDELGQIIPLLKYQGNFTSLIHCNDGILTKVVDLPVKLAFKKEACELNLAPTSSSTLMLAFGDALGVVASSMRGFTQSDFARFHPGGTLGKNLLLKVESLMVKGDQVPQVNADTIFTEILFKITSGRKGACVVVDNNSKPLGIITDGDLRRACGVGSDVFNKNASDVMTPSPKTISKDMRALKVLEIMEEHGITSLIVEENGKIVGLVHIHEILKAGIKKK